MRYGSLTSESDRKYIIEEIRFKEYGLRSIEVIDNGSGISRENYESIGEPYATSMLHCSNAGLKL